MNNTSHTWPFSEVMNKMFWNRMLRILILQGEGMPR